jgi:hypothetical protein
MTAAAADLETTINIDSHYSPWSVPRVKWFKDMLVKGAQAAPYLLQ